MRSRDYAALGAGQANSYGSFRCAFSCLETRTFCRVANCLARSCTCYCSTWRTTLRLNKDRDSGKTLRSARSLSHATATFGRRFTVCSPTRCSRLSSHVWLTSTHDFLTGFGFHWYTSRTHSVETLTKSLFSSGSSASTTTI